MKLPSFCDRISCLRTANHAVAFERTVFRSQAATHHSSAWEPEPCTQHTHRIKAVNKNETIKEGLPDTTALAALESLAQPVGTFAGTEDRILRIRNGQIIPAGAGSQGGGQN